MAALFIDGDMMITTDRLTLRAAMPRDLDELFDIYRRPEAMKYWSSPPHQTKAETQENLDRLIASHAKQLVYFVITMNKRVIGVAGMHKENEIGFILHPNFWRMGIITEAMGAIIPYLFDVTDVPELTADADPNNLASVNCLKKLGFAETHRVKDTYCINGVWSDSVYFALPRPR